MEYAAELEISTDGIQVAYVRRWSDPLTDRRYGNIWVVKRDGATTIFVAYFGGR